MFNLGLSLLKKVFICFFAIGLSAGFSISPDDIYARTSLQELEASIQGIEDQALRARIQSQYDDLQNQIIELTKKIEEIENKDSSPVRFTDMGNGTIRDNKTGIIWLKDANCIELPGIDSYGRATWEDAKSAARSLADGVCGLKDGSKAREWRLPTKEEWEVFMSEEYDYPAVVNTVGDAQWSEGDAFTGVQSYYYWSDTEYTGSLAWQGFLPYGVALYNNKELKRCVWPVRRGN